MVEIYRPFGVDVSETIEEPSDLVTHLAEAGKVVRFDNPNLPPAVIVDDTRSHSARMATLARILFEGRDRLTRMCWVHDLAEPFAFGNSDVSIVAKNYMTQQELDAIENRELAAAGRIFAPADYAIFEDFINAEIFLRGIDVEPALFTKDGIDANCLDKSEGNMYAHYCLAKWASVSYSPAVYEANHPMLLHTFSQYEKYVQRLVRYESLGGNAGDAFFILKLQLECIRSFWEELGGRIPKEVNQYLFVS